VTDKVPRVSDGVTVSHTVLTKRVNNDSFKMSQHLVHVENFKHWLTLRALRKVNACKSDKTMCLWQSVPCTFFLVSTKLGRGTRQRSWFRHYATSRKVTGSIPDQVIGFFNLLKLSGGTMALGSTQPLTEMSTRKLPGGKGRPAHKADNFTAICEPLSR
jgi:hypothetical protein